MRIGIDLLWVRVGICGGTESYIRNLLVGFSQNKTENEYVLFVSKDNAESFRGYETDKRMRLSVCPVRSAKQGIRILWENLYLNKAAKREKIDVMFIPVYSKPMAYGSKIPYVTVIADLQAIHYPQYFSGIRKLFFKFAWRNTCKTSQRIITISDFCKEDIIKHYPSAQNKIYNLYVPVISNESKLEFSDLEERFRIKKNKYFYCVSSLLPHKNLDTVLRVMQRRKEQGLVEEKLVLSGVGGDIETFQQRVEELNIHDMIILTGYISDAERDCFYENCRIFLFPSVFEGFGMPPIEAMRKGKTVVTTECACLKEITEGKAVYVKNPMNVEEWMEKIEVACERKGTTEQFEKYSLENVSGQYLKVLMECAVKR